MFTRLNAINKYFNSSFVTHMNDYKPQNTFIKMDCNNLIFEQLNHINKAIEAKSPLAAAFAARWASCKARLSAFVVVLDFKGSEFDGTSFCSFETSFPLFSARNSQPN